MPETADDFRSRIVEVLDAASLSLLLSIGHQIGLLDTMSGRGPATSAEIADAAGLNERYVREWLGGMASGQVVDYDPASGTYLLPAHRAEVLTRSAGTGNLALIAQYIPLLSEVEQQVIGCFRTGGGVPYSAYPRFHAVMGERTGAVFDNGLIDVVLPAVDGLVDRLRSGIDVADFGCGSGHALNLMAQAFPQSRFTGLDLSEEAIAAGLAESRRLGLTNTSFEVANLTDFDDANRFDVITAFDTIHDQAQPAQVLGNIHRALRPGGQLLMADVKASSRLEDNVDAPLSTYRYTTSLMHCMTVSLALNGVGLGTMWGRQRATEMLAEAGFPVVVVTEAESDPFNYLYVAAK